MPGRRTVRPGLMLTHLFVSQDERCSGSRGRKSDASNFPHYRQYQTNVFRYRASARTTQANPTQAILQQGASSARVWAALRRHPQTLGKQLFELSNKSSCVIHPNHSTYALYRFCGPLFNAGMPASVALPTCPTSGNTQDIALLAAHDNMSAISAYTLAPCQPFTQPTTTDQEGQRACIYCRAWASSWTLVTEIHRRDRSE